MSVVRRAETLSVVKILVFCLGVAGVYGQACTENVKTWVGIREENYDRNYSSIFYQTARPLGFDRATIYYGRIEEPNPCIKVTNIDDTRVEVMAESNPPGSSFCVNDQYSREMCGARIYDCRPANRQVGGEDSITFEFYCDPTRCIETNISVFYRFTVSPSADRLDPELFCDSRDASEYPSNLKPPLPTISDLPTMSDNQSMEQTTEQTTDHTTTVLDQTPSLGLTLQPTLLCLVSSGVLHVGKAWTCI